MRLLKHAWGQLRSLKAEWVQIKIVETSCWTYLHDLDPKVFNQHDWLKPLFNQIFARHFMVSRESKMQINSMRLYNFNTKIHKSRTWRISKTKWTMQNEKFVDFHQICGRFFWKWKIHKSEDYCIKVASFLISNTDSVALNWNKHHHYYCGPPNVKNPENFVRIS